MARKRTPWLVILLVVAAAALVAAIGAVMLSGKLSYTEDAVEVTLIPPSR